jgi:hypothetical protein
MRSGDPQPNDDLRHVLAAKKNAVSNTLEVVSESAAWLKGALKGADVPFSYGSCEEKDPFGFAAFTVVRSYRGTPTTLHLKIAEIRDTAFIFAEVRSHGKAEGTLFPFFGDLSSEDHRNLLLHYVADFVASTSL